MPASKVLRSDKFFRARVLLQEVYHLITRDSDRRPSHPTWRARQARYFRRHQVCNKSELPYPTIAPRGSWLTCLSVLERRCQVDSPGCGSYCCILSCTLYLSYTILVSGHDIPILGVRRGCCGELIGHWKPYTSPREDRQSRLGAGTLSSIFMGANINHNLSSDRVLRKI